MKASKPVHPLEKVRDILGLTRERLARMGGVKTATVQNIERGRAPMTAHLAQLIEANTSCSAVWLLQASHDFRKDPDLADRVPIDLEGKPLTEERYERYLKEQISDEGAALCVADLSRRLAMLLGGLRDRPHAFRSAYRQIVYAFDEIRQSTGLSDEGIEATVMQSATARQYEKTLGELMAEPDFAAPGFWEKEGLVEKYGTDAKVSVHEETCPWWPDVRNLIDETGSFCAAEGVLVDRVVRRLVMPDNKVFVLRRHHTRMKAVYQNFGPDLPKMPVVSGNPGDKLSLNAHLLAKPVVVPPSGKKPDA